MRTRRIPTAWILSPFSTVAIASSARKVADKIRAAFEDAGYRFHEENVENVTVGVYEFGNGDTSPYVFFERDNTMVVCPNLKLAKQIIEQWTQGGDDCLASNEQFAAVMSHCRGTKDEAPQISAYVDPIGIFRATAVGNPGAQIMLAMLPAIGLDGLKAAGASLVLSTEDFDGILNLHVLLDSPRAGVLDLIAVESGDDTPPAWVPADMATYWSLHWDVQQTFDRGTKLGDTFGTTGSTATRINDRATRMLGADFEHDILPALAGRFIHVTWFERPARVGVGGSQIIGVRLNDAKAFHDTFDKIVDHFGDRIEKKTVAGAAYYLQKVDRKPEDTRPVPCFAQMSDWVLVGDRPAIMEHILSHREDTSDTLAAALDYKLIAAKIARQPGGAKPGLLSFSRPDEAWKYLYDLAASENTRNMLRDRSANNPVLGALNQGLSDNPLPPWEAIARYLAPEGAMITDDDSGIHYMQFTLRRK